MLLFAETLAWLKLVMDMIIESGNDIHDDEYRQVASQEDFDSF